MRRYWLATCAVLLVPTAAQAMTVQQFLTKVDKLKALGPLALMSPDMTELKTEMTAITRQYHADKVAAAKAGRPISCAPDGAKMSTDEILGAMNAIPPAQRGMSLKQAFYGIVKKRYPCPPRGAHSATPR